MTSPTTQGQLHKQPDDNVQQIESLYVDWNCRHWEDLSLEQFFREKDEVGYSLDDAQEIYRS